MKNAQFDSLEIKRCCEKKLDVTFRDGRELNGWVEINGKKFARITVPKGRKEIPKGTYGSMARQLKISNKEFDELLECTLVRKEYEKIVITPDS